MELYNDNCFNIFPEIQDKHIDLFVLDLPYANFKFGKCTACKWDLPIDLDEMWKHIKRIMKPNAVIVFFCNTKFGYALIDSNPKWFKYDLIWKKSRKVGFLSANKQPLRQHENIYVFNNQKATYNPQKTEGKAYKAFETKNNKQIGEVYGGKSLHNENKGDRHPTSILPDIEFEEHENVYVFNKQKATYNPQKTERDKDYKHSGKRSSNPHYNDILKCGKEYKKEDGKHPTSILPDIELEEHENVYIFNDRPVTHSKNKDQEYSTYNPQKTEGKPFKVKGGKSKKVDGSLSRGHEVISKEYQNKGDRHPSSILPDIELEEHENLYVFNKQKATYNPQKTEGKPYNATRQNGNIYRDKIENIPTINKGDRHPTSILPDDLESTILEYNNPHKTIHRTQKPEKLLEWLIKTYSNENDVVMDFCMGSGTAGVACKNLNRKFIGVEMDKEIYDLAYKRINKTQ